MPTGASIEARLAAAGLPSLRRLAWLEMQIALKQILTQCHWEFVSSADPSPLVPEGSFKIRLSRPVFIKLDRRQR